MSADSDLCLPKVCRIITRTSHEVVTASVARDNIDLCTADRRRPLNWSSSNVLRVSGVSAHPDHFFPRFTPPLLSFRLVLPFCQYPSSDLFHRSTLCPLLCLTRRHPPPTRLHFFVDICWSPNPHQRIPMCRNSKAHNTTSQHVSAAQPIIGIAMMTSRCDSLTSWFGMESRTPAKPRRCNCF